MSGVRKGEAGSSLSFDAIRCSIPFAFLAFRLEALAKPLYSTFDFFTGHFSNCPDVPRILLFRLPSHLTVLIYDFFCSAPLYSRGLGNIRNDWGLGGLLEV